MVRSIVAILAVVAALASAPAEAQVRDSRLAAEINKGTVGLVSGGINGTYIRIAADLEAVLEETSEVRVLPVIGQGSLQNVKDVLYLKGVDVGIVQADVLEHLKKSGAYGDIENRLRYVTKLYNEEFHLIASDAVRSIEELAGKKVNFGNEGSGTHMTATLVFEALGVSVEPTSFDQATAIEKVKTGEIAAAVFVAGKPTTAFSSLRPEDGLHLVPIEYAGKVRDTYLPSSFTDSDYPALVPPGGKVPTLAVGAVMAVFNWDEGSARYERVAQFVEAFFTSFDKLQQQPRHAKWREVNLSAELPGWTRFKAAESWLAANATVSATDLIDSFKTFLAENQVATDGKGVPVDQREQLFQQFILWQRQQDQ